MGERCMHMHWSLWCALGIAPAVHRSSKETPLPSIKRLVQFLPWYVEIVLYCTYGHRYKEEDVGSFWLASTSQFCFCLEAHVPLVQEGDEELFIFSTKTFFLYVCGKGVQGKTIVQVLHENESLWRMVYHIAYCTLTDLVRAHWIDLQHLE